MAAALTPSWGRHSSCHGTAMRRPWQSPWAGMAPPWRPQWCHRSSWAHHGGRHWAAMGPPWVAMAAAMEPLWEGHGAAVVGPQWVRHGCHHGGRHWPPWDRNWDSHRAAMVPLWRPLWRPSWNHQAAGMRRHGTAVGSPWCPHLVRHGAAVAPAIAAATAADMGPPLGFPWGHHEAAMEPQ